LLRTAGKISAAPRHTLQSILSSHA
jgi:hypothetical protein